MLELKPSQVINLYKATQSELKLSYNQHDDLHFHIGSVEVLSQLREIYPNYMMDIEPIWC